MTKILTVDALAAAGKTYSATRYIKSQVRAGERFIYTVPSILLLEQIKTDLIEIGCQRVLAIHSEDGSPETVSSRLTKHFQNTDYDAGEVVIMTFAAFERLKYIERRGDWHLIVDELPQIVWHDRISLMENRHRLLKLITDAPDNAAYSMLHASEDDTGYVEDVARNRFCDRITTQLQEVANKLLSDDWDVFCLSSQLETFRTTENTVNAIDIFAILQPTIFDAFKSVTMMGACLEESMIYQHWLSLRIKFQPHPHIKPRFETYPNADLVTIQYAIDRPWSGKLRDGLQPDGRRTIDHIAERCLAALRGAPFVYLVNKDDPIVLDGTELPHAVHGLNSFQGFHNAMVLSALNPPPAYFGFCSDKMGLDSEEIRTAIYRTSALQAAARISIRDLDNKNAKLVQVADRHTADWIANVIGTNKVEKLPGHDLVEPDMRERDKPKSDVERTQKYRVEKKARLIADMEKINEPSPAFTTSYTIKDTVNAEIGLGYFGGSIFVDVYTSVPLGQFGPISMPNFVDFLRDLHTRHLARRNELHISPAIFADVGTKAVADIEKMWGVWLDCDDGAEITPEKFAALFPHVKFIAYSTAGITAELLKYRIAIPTTHAMSAEAYKEIQTQIREIIRKQGFYDNDAIMDRRVKDPNAKASGFDRKHTASLYALPVQPVAGTEYAFFEVFDGPTRKPIDPFVWIDRTIIDHRPMAEPITKMIDCDTLTEMAYLALQRTLMAFENGEIPADID